VTFTTLINNKRLILTSCTFHHSVQQIAIYVVRNSKPYIQCRAVPIF